MEYWSSKELELHALRNPFSMFDTTSPTEHTLGLNFPLYRPICDLSIKDISLPTALTQNSNLGYAGYLR